MYSRHLALSHARACSYDMLKSGFGVEVIALYSSTNFLCFSLSAVEPVQASCGTRSALQCCADGCVFSIRRRSSTASAVKLVKLALIEDTFFFHGPQRPSLGKGAPGKCNGIGSLRGASSSSSSKDPAHSSRLVNQSVKLNKVLIVAGMLECSNWLVGNGPLGD
jgi:hypothetical protein